MFLAACKAAQQLRDRAEMDPSRLVNHQVIATLLDSPEFAELRRDTAGDPYAAAMALIAHGEALRRMLDNADQAQQAAQAVDEAARQALAVAAPGVHTASAGIRPGGSTASRSSSRSYPAITPNSAAVSDQDGGASGGDQPAATSSACPGPPDAGHTALLPDR